jgi:hypothetical protein
MYVFDADTLEIVSGIQPLKAAVSLLVGTTPPTQLPVVVQVPPPALAQMISDA